MTELALETLDHRIAELAERDADLTAAIVREAVRLPADHVDRPTEQGGDPRCGTSNHEAPRLEYLKEMLIEHRGVRSAADVSYDAFGNLVWSIEDPSDPTPREQKRVIYWDGHCDTVRPLRDEWRSKTGGLDPYDGLIDPARLDRAFLRRELGWLPPDDEWSHLIFGRGSADQLGGVAAQIVASRILLELAGEGSLSGAIVRGYITVAEEDNDGGGPQYVMRHVLPGAPPETIPDVVILTDSTGDAEKGALGLHRGQRGRMQIEVRVVGRSSHGSMPWEGLNPLEFGGAILAEAAQRHDFLDHPFLGRGTRTASFATLETPSDCAVPDSFTFRFDRRLTLGETPEKALAEVDSLAAVAAARGAGLTVHVGVPRYATPTWTGYVPGNAQVYMGWMTPAEHPTIRAAVECYRRVVTPHVTNAREQGGSLRRQPRVDRWTFSTDGVGFPARAEESTIHVPSAKRWVVAGSVWHPAMFGIGPGIEQNTHKIGECLDGRELPHAVAFLARYPSVLASTMGG